MRIIYLIVFLGGLGSSFIYPIFAPMLVNGNSAIFFDNQTLSAGTSFGMLIASYPLGMLFGAPLLGIASDRYGRKKLLIITIVFTIIGYLFTAYAFTNGLFFGFLASRFFVGIFEGKLSVARAIAVDNTTSKGSVIALSKINASSSAGMLIGPAAGGLLYSNNFEHVFLVPVAFYMIALFSVYFKLNVKESAQRLPKSKENSLGKNSLVFKLMITYLFMSMAIGCAYHFIPVWLAIDLSMTAKSIGFTNALMTLFMVVVSYFFVTKLVSRLDLYSSFISSSVLLSCCYLFISLNITYYSLIIFMFTGALITIMQSTYSAYVIETIGKENSGLLFGSLSSMTSLGVIIVSLIGSQLISIKATAPILLSSIIIISTVIFFSMTNIRSYANTK
jgi:MFS family permease